MRIKLFYKMLLLAIVPLICAAYFVSVIASISEQAEKEAARSERAGRTNNLIGRLVQACYEGMRTVKIGDVLKTGVVPFERDERIREAEQIVDELKVSLKDNPKRIAALEQVLRSAKGASSVVDEALAAYKRGDKDPNLEVQLRKKATDYTRAMFPQEVYDMASEEKAIESAGPAIQAALRAELRKVLVYELLMLVLSIVAAWYVSQGVTRRIENVSENSLRLANGVSLCAPLAGNDEMAQLDHTFHQVAKLLADAAQRERALIENASDIICSIDKSGRFTNINAAALAVLGYTPEDLWGKYYIDLVHPDDVKATLESVEKCVENGSIQPFETRLKRKQGLYADVLISARFSESEQLMFCVIHDVTERKDAERMKQEVIAMVSHDLKTPLTTIRHVVELLGGGTGGALNNAGVQLVERADSASATMLSLINDLLDLERIKSGMLELAKSEVRLEDVFQQSIEVVSGLSEKRSVPVVVEPTDIVLFADADRLLRIVVNLLSNAIKFSPSGNPVVLAASDDSDGIVISIIDRGRGIPEHLTGGIFGKFTQVEGADAVKQGGSGLGLAICKALVELHGGAIWVETEEGKGSKFSFRIPKSVVESVSD